MDKSIGEYLKSKVNDYAGRRVNLWETDKYESYMAEWAWEICQLFPKPADNSSGYELEPTSGTLISTCPYGGFYAARD